MLNQAAALAFMLDLANQIADSVWPSPDRSTIDWSGRDILPSRLTSPFLGLDVLTQDMPDDARYELAHSHVRGLEKSATAFFVDWGGCSALLIKALMDAASDSGQTPGQQADLLGELMGRCRGDADRLRGGSGLESSRGRLGLPGILEAASSLQGIPIWLADNWSSVVASATGGALLTGATNARAHLSNLVASLFAPKARGQHKPLAAQILERTELQGLTDFLGDEQQRFDYATSVAVSALHLSACFKAYGLNQEESEELLRGQRVENHGALKELRREGLVINAEFSPGETRWILMPSEVRKLMLQ